MKSKQSEETSLTKQDYLMMMYNQQAAASWDFPSWSPWCQRRWVADFMAVQPKGVR